MTISYSGNVVRLFLRWKGSLWKAVWKELFIFLTLYYLIRLIYNVVLDEDQKEYFEELVLVFGEYTKLIPLTFLLGFYVTAIVTRWWSQFEWVAWPDDLLSFTCLVIPGSDEQSKLKRHTIARYLLLTAALAWRDVSVKVRKRFPTIDNIVKSGLMTEDELKLYEINKSDPVHWYLPLQWVQNIIQKDFEQGKIAAPIVSGFLGQLCQYRLSFRKLYCYDWVCIPLVYTQVAALATYGYFALCLLGRQFLDPAKGYDLQKIDFYVPIFTILQFLFYVGWFKVGQYLIGPFGTDDDDIELNYILDRHIRASFLIVNQTYSQQPPLVPDKFFETQKFHVPHTKMSAKLKENAPKLHASVPISKNDDAEVLWGIEETKRRLLNYPVEAVQRVYFEELVLEFGEYTQLIPLTFLLGFYVTAIVTRWWSQFNWVAWPDDLLSFTCLVIHGSDEQSKLKRHTIARYLLLTAALAWRDVSVKVRKRFPTIDNIVKSGLMTEDELKLYEMNKSDPVHWYLPLQWVQNIIQKDFEQGKIAAPIVSGFLGQLCQYRLSFRKLYCYDWVCIPLVYTQVAALATYGYFALCLLGRQFLDPAKGYDLQKIDLYVPIFTILQFLFYVGWFKVGQDLIRPFGTDDDDIELNYILDRHIRASFLIVNQTYSQQPPLVPDKFFETQKFYVPHTKMSAKLKEHAPKLHASVPISKNDDAEVLWGIEETKRRLLKYPAEAVQRDTFEKVALLFGEYTKLMPLTFLLGFYVTSLVTLWWAQFEWVAWPDDLVSFTCFVIDGSDDESKLKRHTIARYLLLTAVLAWRDVSTKVRKRFPTIYNVVKTNLMTKDEFKLYDSIKSDPVRWFLPLQWIQKIIRKEFDEGKIPAPIASNFVTMLSEYRLSFRKLYCYDWVCVPLVYTQVAALATYGYFGFCLIGRQYLDAKKEYAYNDVDLFVPIFTILQFLFYVGWLRVGQDLKNPFGTDDDDIELNYILDRHIQTSFLLVNQVHELEPPLKPDKFFTSKQFCVPHTITSAKIKNHPPKLHAFVEINKPEDTKCHRKPISDKAKGNSTEIKEGVGDQNKQRPFLVW